MLGNWRQPSHEGSDMRKHFLQLNAISPINLMQWKGKSVDLIERIILKVKLQNFIKEAVTFKVKYFSENFF